MSINELSIGSFYAALTPQEEESPRRRLFWPMVAVVTELNTPWRRGKCVVFPTGTYNILAIGWWTSDIQDDIAVDFPDDEWPLEWRGWEPEDTETSPGFLKGVWLKDLNGLEEEGEDTGGVPES